MKFMIRFISQKYMIFTTTQRKLNGLLDLRHKMPINISDDISFVSEQHVPTRAHTY